MTQVFNLYLAVDPEGFGYVGCTRHSAEHRWRTHFGNPPRRWPGRDGAGMSDGIKRFGRSSFQMQHIASAIGRENAAAAEAALIAQYGTLAPKGYNRQAAGGQGLVRAGEARA